jgi:hypothetical protein
LFQRHVVMFEVGAAVGVAGIEEEPENCHRRGRSAPERR